MAACEATMEALAMRKLEELLPPKVLKFCLGIDSQAAFVMATNPSYGRRTRHIELWWPYVREHIEKKSIVLRKVKGDEAPWMHSQSYGTRKDSGACQSCLELTTLSMSNSKSDLQGGGVLGYVYETMRKRYPTQERSCKVASPVLYVDESMWRWELASVMVVTTS